jgi:mono/diheme cytochrome c family protein
MTTLRVIAAGALVAWGSLAANVIPGDARRGEQLFQSARCVQCHSINGKGGSTAPDLARRIDRNFTPAQMASTMWNHAPRMWSEMKQQGISQPVLSPEQASDLFAFFISARYFEKPGDAARGKQAFASKHCADCHGITSSPVAAAPPVAKWQSLADPLVLAQQMWNHGAKMREEFARKKFAWQQLTAQELTDMLVYLQNLPETRHLATNVAFPPADAGEKLFESKGCADCHKGSLALENRLHNQTLTEIAVDMWNHQPKMKNPPPTLSPEEMRQILSYVWARQYFTSTGNASAGKKVFADKNCARCHESGSAPKLAKGKDAQSPITMVAALWGHGPRMLDLMTSQKLAWPQFTGTQMSDLIAYLNTLP